MAILLNMSFIKLLIPVFCLGGNRQPWMDLLQVPRPSVLFPLFPSWILLPFSFSEVFFFYPLYSSCLYFSSLLFLVLALLQELESSVLSAVCFPLEFALALCGKLGLLFFLHYFVGTVSLSFLLYIVVHVLDKDCIHCPVLYE
ncbi:hypothetical protein SLA2020_158070 [Shorea laevis]